VVRGGRYVLMLVHPGLRSSTRPPCRTAGAIEGLGGGGGLFLGSGKGTTLSRCPGRRATYGSHAPSRARPHAGRVLFLEFRGVGNRIGCMLEKGVRRVAFDEPAHVASRRFALNGGEARSRSTLSFCGKGRLRHPNREKAVLGGADLVPPDHPDDGPPTCPAPLSDRCLGGIALRGTIQDYFAG